MKLERSYGGKAGIWLKRRRTQVSLALTLKPSDAPEKQQKNDDDDINEPDEEAKEVEDFPTQCSQECIGWDDVLCRPIYKTTTKKPDTNQDDVKESPPPTPPNNNSDWAFEKKSRKKYGARKILRLALSRADWKSDSYLGKRKSDEDDEARNSSAETDSITSSPSSEVAAREPSSTTLDEDEQIKSSNTTSVLETLAPPPPETKNRLVRTSKRRKRASSSLVKPTPPSDDSSVFDFCDEPIVIQQPSSNTSVDAARAYFEKLDCTEHLVIVHGNNNSPSPKQRQSCVRTRRNLIASPSLKNEYSKYAAATAESGVHPVSMKEYALHRETFFRASEIYDGSTDK